jgi:short subunit dehydrogenase-like uncharacterized protein
MGTVQGERGYDLALFGATGFTGGLTLGTWPRTVPPGCAGRARRSQSRRARAVAAELAAVESEVSAPEILEADAAGQVTTVTAMGDALLTRLRSAGIAFEVLEPAQA